LPVLQYCRSSPAE